MAARISFSTCVTKSRLLFSAAGSIFTIAASRVPCAFSAVVFHERLTVKAGAGLGLITAGTLVMLI